MSSPKRKLEGKRLAFLKFTSYKNKSFNRYRTAIIIFIGVIGGALLCYGFILHFRSDNNYDDVLFTSKKVVTSGVPNTVIFQYDISCIDTDSVHIQQSWNERQRTPLSRDNHYYTSVYYYPGFHRAKLVVEDKVIKQHNVHITTDGWLAIVQTRTHTQIPIYIPNSDIMDGRRLYVSPEILKSNKIDPTDEEYGVRFYHVRDFGPLDGDNFTLETCIKNDLAEGGLVGQYCNLVVMNVNGRHIIPLTIPGCVGNVNVKFMDALIRGRENDLSMFGCDMSEWNTLKCEVKDRLVKIFLNGSLIYQLSYENPAGRIIGLNYGFYGCGAIDFIRLWDVNQQLIFEDEFTDESISP